MSTEDNKSKKNYKYVIISSVCNAEKYLNDFYVSITKQTIGFQDFILLIMVDDGSTDQSASIIKSWQKQYPSNIVYIHKESGGQPSAWNLGLEHAKGEWITFVDSVDFVDENYFAVVEQFLNETDRKNIGLISCKAKFYDESVDPKISKHPLNYRFKSGNRVIPAANPGYFIEVNVCGVFFNADYLINSRLRMNEAVKSSFVNSHFVNSYLMINPDIDIGVVAKAKYYYRKRVENLILLNNQKAHHDYYFNVLINGHLDLISEAKDRFGFVPQWLQRILLYDLVNRVKDIIKDAGKISSLGEEGIIEYYRLFAEITLNIDDQVVIDYELAKTREIHKLIILSVFKGKNFVTDKVNITDYDSNRRLIKVSYYYKDEQPQEEYYLNKERLPVAFSKNIDYVFPGQGKLVQRIVWLPYYNDEPGKTFKFKIDNTLKDIFVKNLSSGKSICLNEIFNRLDKKYKVKSKMPRKDRLIRYLANTKIVRLFLKDAWLFIDRDLQADDNAEHLYSYVKNNYPEVNAYFIIRKSSHDSSRLKQRGFRLAWFGSLKHKLALLNAQYLITSHVTKYTTEYLPKIYYRDMLKHDIVFLQHGVIVHDMSNRLNKKKINLFITSGGPEYQSIVGDGTHYRYSEKEVALTGLPRHDKLLRGDDPKKMVLVMPTWRRSLIGPGREDSSARILAGEQQNRELQNTEFFNRWNAFLSDPALTDLVKSYGYKVIFFPHAYLKDLLQYFQVPESVEVLHHDDRFSIQKLFQEAGCLITDYSSVAFEMAYLLKPVLYYQFDHEFFFGGGHSFRKGYFDYNNDGFGPVCYDQNVLLYELKCVIERGCKPENQYLEKMANFFPYRDGKCCERAYSAIKNVAKPYSFDAVKNNSEILER